MCCYRRNVRTDNLFFERRFPEGLFLDLDHDRSMFTGITVARFRIILRRSWFYYTPSVPARLKIRLLSSHLPCSGIGTFPVGHIISDKWVASLSCTLSPSPGEVDAMRCQTQAAQQLSLATHLAEVPNQFWLAAQPETEVFLLYSRPPWARSPVQLEWTPSETEREAMTSFNDVMCTFRVQTRTSIIGV